MSYVDQHKDVFGVEPICAVLAEADVKIAPSTYYAARSRSPCARAVRDGVISEKITRVHAANYGVYGVRKVAAEIARGGGVDGRPVARCTVARLMKSLGLHGVSRLKTPRTTRSGKGRDDRPDLVKRAFTATTVNRLWVADITYVRCFSGWVYAAFVLDVFSRRIVGWQVSTSLRTDLALDALNMGLWTRARDGQDTSRLVHHSDRGVQYVAVRYTQRLAEAGAVASVGSKGDSYDNAMAEAFNSIFKAELIRNKGPWYGIDDLEIAVAEYVEWFNHRRLHGELGLIPPVEYENKNNHPDHTDPKTEAEAASPPESLAPLRDGHRRRAGSGPVPPTSRAATAVAEATGKDPAAAAPGSCPALDPGAPTDPAGDTKGRPQPAPAHARRNQNKILKHRVRQDHLPGVDVPTQPTVSLTSG